MFNSLRLRFRRADVQNERFIEPVPGPTPAGTTSTAQTRLTASQILDALSPQLYFKLCDLQTPLVPVCVTKVPTLVLSAGLGSRSLCIPYLFFLLENMQLPPSCALGWISRQQRWIDGQRFQKDGFRFSNTSPPSQSLRVSNDGKRYIKLQVHEQGKCEEHVLRWSLTDK